MLIGCHRDVGKIYGYGGRDEPTAESTKGRTALGCEGHVCV